MRWEIGGEEGRGEGRRRRRGEDKKIVRRGEGRRIRRRGGIIGK